MSPALRLHLTALYVASVGLNAGMVWLALLLSSAGLRNGQVAALLLCVPVAGLLAAPLQAWWADRHDDRAGALRIASVVVWFGALGVQLGGTVASFALALCVLGAGRPAQSALLDGTTLELLGEQRDQYGSLRAWGTASFVATVAIGGLLQQRFAGGGWWPAVLLASCAVVLTWRLPRARVGAVPRSPWPLLQHPELRPLAVVGVLHGVTLSSYDAFFSLLVAERGLPASITGAAVAAGALTEVVVFALGAPLLRVVGDRRLVWIGVLSGLPRWVGTAWVQAPAALIALQCLHGLGFGAFWLGGVSLVARLAPRDLSSSAQAMLGVCTFGLGTVLTMAAGSQLLDRVGVERWFAGLAVVSVLAASAFAAQSSSIPGAGCCRGAPRRP